VHTPEAGINDFIIYEALGISHENLEISFDIEIEQSQKETMLDAIMEAQNILSIDETMTYRISDSFGNWIDDDIIYLNATDFYTDNNYICFTLLKHFGEETNYGLLYGYSQYLQNTNIQLDYQALADVCISDSYIFDLTWPLFLSDYVTDNILDLVKSISTNFVSYLIETYGEESFQTLLSQSGTFDFQFDSNLASNLNEWLLFMNIDYEVIPSSIAIRFTTVSSYYPVMAETDWAMYHINKDFLIDQLSIASPLLTNCNEFVFANYEELKLFLIKIEQQMTKVREYINNDLSVDTYGKIHIYYNEIYNDVDPSHPGFFYGTDANSGIRLSIAVGATIHEYIHYATIGTMYKDVPTEFQIYFKEGIAVYLSNLFDADWVSATKLGYEYFLENPAEDADTNSFIVNYRDYLNTNQLDFDINDYTDCLVYSIKQRNKTPYYYWSSCSFVCYIIDTYGTDKLWNYVGNGNTFENIYGKSITDMLSEWNLYLVNKFQ
jgi:hypothetical protein